MKDIHYETVLVDIRNRAWSIMETKTHYGWNVAIQKIIIPI